jgi:hypothetical protein
MEGHRPREQPDDQERAADQFEQAGDPADREEYRARVIRRRKAEQFRRAVLEKQKRRDDAQDAQDARGPNGLQCVHVSSFRLMAPSLGLATQPSKLIVATLKRPLKRSVDASNQFPGTELLGDDAGLLQKFPPRRQLPRRFTQ